jgi:hypothetical protein
MVAMKVGLRDVGMADCWAERMVAMKVGLRDVGMADCWAVSLMMAG